MEPNRELVRRAGVHSALGDPARLAIVDALSLGEASPSELQALLGLPSNLLAHHVRVLERAGVIARSRSEGDRRRTYLTLRPQSFDTLRGPAGRGAGRVVFVCTENSARSQLAAALWSANSAVPVASAGTHPAPRVHRGALAAARRRRLVMTPTTPRHVDDVLGSGDVVITVCDSAHEQLSAARDGSRRRELGGDATERRWWPAGAAQWLHWSVPDPVRVGDTDAFDRALDELAGRVSRVAPTVHSLTAAPPGP